MNVSVESNAGRGHDTKLVIPFGFHIYRGCGIIIYGSVRLHLQAQFLVSLIKAFASPCVIANYNGRRAYQKANLLKAGRYRNRTKRRSEDASRVLPVTCAENNASVSLQS
jgi:hypothetical protein